MKINTIYNDDAYKFVKEIPDKSIDLIYTDIPYLIYSGGDSGGGGNSKLSKRILKINKHDLKGINKGINYEILYEFKRVLKKINLFIWCSKLQIIDILNIFNEKNINYEILTWNKTNPTPATNNVWLPDIEYCLYFREKGVKLNDGYDLKSKWYISPLNINDKKLYDHPTIKPLDLVKRHILHTTQESDLVLDCFSGSGTTCIASLETKRNYIGIEIDPKWYQTSLNRIKGINNKDLKEKEIGIQTIFDYL